MFPVNGWPLSDQQSEFVRSLFVDLRPLGFDVSIQGKNLRFVQEAPTSTTQYKEFYAEAHKRLHKKDLSYKRVSIIEFEKAHGPSAFIEGKRLNLPAIEPRLRPVDLRQKANPSQRDRAVVDYLRAYQTVSSRRSVGRENAYILEDWGHPNLPIMGALVLSSSRYYQPNRDDVLGWVSPSKLNSMSMTRQLKATKIRYAGLNRTMQVAICCALPPYSRLGAASLLAVAPFVRIVQDDFRARWYNARSNRDPDLAAVTTTTSMGLTGTPFQALYVSMFFDAASSAPRGDKWNQENTIYSRIRERHPWLANVPVRAKESHADFRELVSSRTWNLALRVAGPRIETKRREWVLDHMSPERRNKVLQYALQNVGLTSGIFSGNPVGVFLGAIDKPALEALKEGRRRKERPILSWDKALARFKSEFDIQAAVQSGDARRQRAVRERVNRALKTTLDDIRLSNH